MKTLSLIASISLVCSPLFAAPAGPTTGNETTIVAPAATGSVPEKPEAPKKPLHRAKRGGHRPVERTAAPEVQKTESTTNHNITIQTQDGRGDVHKARQSFCGKSAAEAVNACESWKKEQKSTLGEKVLTSSCGQARNLYGKEVDGCMSFISYGDITYLIK
jgi:hypothetical protein